MKRVFDILFSIFAIVIFAPLFIIIALIIKITDKGPIFFTQDRIGFNLKNFKIIKFRTMYPDAEERLKELLKIDENAKKEWEQTFKLKNDPRITPIGKFLRKTSLDELPQFINVLKGDMSVVGPRPIVKEELDKFYKGKEYIFKKVKPGITGPWQVGGRSNIDDYKIRVKLDEEYANHHTFLNDIIIIIKTIKSVFKGDGAY